MAESTGDTPIPLKLETGDNKVPAMVYGETGYTGLVTLGGRVWDDCQKELRWPRAYHTFKEMSTDSSVHPSLEFVEGKIAEAKWKVRIPKGYEKQLKDKALFLEQQMDDMDQSWLSYIKQIASFNRYGFAINEIALRFRNKRFGSNYDDGLVGLKGLPGRSQGSIYKWEWSQDGRQLLGLWQQVILPYTGTEVITENGWDTARAYEQNRGHTLKFIPRKKFLHFRHNPQNDSPTGQSPLAGVWTSWKYKTAYQTSEALGTAQDANAFKILYLPPDYLTEDADDDRKKSLQMYQRMMTEAHQAKSSGFILPMLTDAEGKRMFDFEIKNISGSKSYDVDKIISRYSREIQVGLFADVLSLGGGSGGSYSLSESKVDIIDMAVKSKLNEIKDQLNHQLIKTLFEQNGWPVDITPFFDYELPNQETLDNKGKYVQRCKAVGMLPVVPQTVNQILRDGGFDYQVPDNMSTEELMKILSPIGEQMSSEAGGGMKSGLPSSNGSGIGSSGDSSVSNTENT